MAKHKSTTEVLHKNEHGSVSVCECCDDMQLNFGNVLIQMPVNGFIRLRQLLRDMISEDALVSISHCSDQKIVIRTPQPNLFITVTPEEFRHLADLLDTAVYMYEVRQLVTGK